MLRTAPLLAALTFAVPALAEVTGAPSAATPTLRRAVTVTSEVVRIGDLVDNAGTAAGIPIFRSPDVGTTGVVSVGQVLDALRAREPRRPGVEAVPALPSPEPRTHCVHPHTLMCLASQGCF